jgi:2-haloacid dehalogenase
MMSSQPTTIIFDLGGVLIDWNPRKIYRDYFKTEEEITWFFENICTLEWNDHQDAGRSFEDGTNELLAKYPEHEAPIRAWYGRSHETIAPIEATVKILEKIKHSNRYRLYALTNWSAESFPVVFEKYKFLHHFDGIVVSGVEKTRKPYAEFYQILFDRYQIDPSKALFIDDNAKNVAGALAIGLPTIHFESPAQLQADLLKIGVLV